ncbi:UNVERIFIED_CONTAM: Calmodulin-binding transcription activator 3 [Sesamum radiatum]|uniref:Calmodulin-binding transcription activator 3 n=1 Tax=Sesamum radiatum TaxID=300843 RepID=A0AAW2K8W8_SESRA
MQMDGQLSSHISSLNLEDSKECNDRGKVVETVTERIQTPASYGDLPHGLSITGLLDVVRNATQVAARIHKVFRVQSFQRKRHQVRKNYSKIIWSVGIVDKVISRWRQKGRGLSGFRLEALGAGISMVDAERKEDDYDFLKEGNKLRRYYRRPLLE